MADGKRMLVVANDATGILYQLEETATASLAEHSEGGLLEVQAMLERALEQVNGYLQEGHL